MAAYISKEICKQVRAVDNGRCAYCQTSEANSGIPLSFDHIQPRAKGGLSILENLCQACRPCNEHKSDQTEAIDPLSNRIVTLFNPRGHHWADHFTWDATGIHILGLTAIGRATIIALDMNNATIKPARRRWVAAGWHPPHH